jgi:hypothetical protein
MTMPYQQPPLDPSTGLPFQQQVPPGSTINVNIPPTEPPQETEFVSRAQMEQILNEERERVRKEEKDKLYPQIEEQKSQLQLLNQEREERIAAQQAEEQRLAEEARLAQESEMSVVQKFEKYQSDSEARFAQIEQERARDREMLAKEQQFSALQQHRYLRLQELGDTIEPRFLDYITGNTPDEIDASIAMAQQKTSELMADIAEAQLGQRRASAPQVSGAPALDPTQMTGEGTQRQLSIEEIRDMPMGEYQQMRGQLLGAASSRVREQGPYAP